MSKEPELDRLIEMYATELDFAQTKLNLLTCILNEKTIDQQIARNHIQDIYIYGGGILGLQLSLAVRNKCSLHGIVDKKEKTIVYLPNVPVLSLFAFQQLYKDETVIVTPLKNISEIQSDLSDFVQKDKLIHVVDFLRG